jgi:hypothetical protein
LFVGDEDAIASLQPPILERNRPPWLMPAAIGGAILVLLVVVLGHC